MPTIGTSLISAHLPGDVSLPAAPGLTEVLQDCACLVLPDALGHHVQDVVHDGRTQLQVKVALHPLLGNGLCHALRVSSLKLPREEVSEPALQEGDHAAHEEHPDTPAGRPQTHTWTFADRTLEGGGGGG